MDLGQQKRAIGVFSREADVKYALDNLKGAGFPMESVSVISKQSDANLGEDMGKSTGNEAGKGAAVGSVTGTAFGLLGGLLASVATISIPGLGPLVVAGSIGSAIAATLAGGGIGAVSGGLLGLFAGLGIPGERAKVYSDRLSQGDYLIVVEGTINDVMRAETLLLNSQGLEEWGIYNADRDETKPVNLEQELKEAAQ